MDKYNQRWVAILFRQPLYAITILNTTYYSCSELRVDRSWRKHEDCHKEQWRRDGIMFPIRYAWNHIRYGYDRNPYEIEALEKERGGRLIPPL